MPAERGGADRTKNFVGFVVGDVRYALDIMRVREVINPLPLVSLPHCPGAVVGVADHRDEVVKIVDLRKLFGLALLPAGTRTRWIIVSSSQGPIGLVADLVTDVFRATEPGQREVPDHGTGEGARAIAAALKHGEDLVFLLDPDRVVPPASPLWSKSWSG